MSLLSFAFLTVTLDNSGKLKSRERKSAYAYTEDLGGGEKLEMVGIPPGEFMMGGSPEFGNNVHPQHRVQIGYWFYMGKFEVTQAQWRAVMGNNPSSFKDCDECPVEQVSWNDAAVLSQAVGANGREFRLLSDAEWEYAARAGITAPVKPNPEKKSISFPTVKRLRPRRAGCYKTVFCMGAFSS